MRACGVVCVLHRGENNDDALGTTLSGNAPYAFMIHHQANDSLSKVLSMSQPRRQVRSLLVRVRLSCLRDRAQSVGLDVLGVTEGSGSGRSFRGAEQGEATPKSLHVVCRLLPSTFPAAATRGWQGHKACRGRCHQARLDAAGICRLVSDLRCRLMLVDVVLGIGWLLCMVAAVASRVNGCGHCLCTVEDKHTALQRVLTKPARSHVINKPGLEYCPLHGYSVVAELVLPTWCCLFQSYREWYTSALRL